MSRNLSSTTCYFCNHAVTLDEPPRPITEGDAGHYFEEYRGMIVANATCPACEARYLAWLDGTHRARSGWPRPETDDAGNLTIRDLSFRSSFNDEPGAEDFPKYAVKIEWVRVGPFERPEWAKEKTA